MFVVFGLVFIVGVVVMGVVYLREVFFIGRFIVGLGIGNWLEWNVLFILSIDLVIVIEFKL